MSPKELLELLKELSLDKLWELSELYPSELELEDSLDRLCELSELGLLSLERLWELSD